MPVWILAGVGGQILLGIILAYAGLPPWSQTAHLVLGAGLLCLVYRAGAASASFRLIGSFVFA